MNDKAVLKIFKTSGALLSGHFKLSSGMHSSQYLQCALVLQNPKYAESLCKALAQKFRDERIDVVVGPALGGVVVSYETARALGCRSVFTERKDKTMVLRRGFEIKKNERVLIVEDVVTTGGSTKEVLSIIKGLGANIIGVGSLVDRSKNIDFNVKFESLLKMDVPLFKEEECPLCKDNMPITKPGSRA